MEGQRTHFALVATPVYRRSALVAGAAVAIFGLVIPATALGATVIGTTATPDRSCAANTLVVQSATAPDATYSVPTGGGVVTSWSTQTGASASNALRMMVLRPLGSGQFLIVGESPPVGLPSGYSFTSAPTSIPVQAGDLLGLLAGSGGADCAYTTASTADVESGRLFPSEPSVGDTFTSNPPLTMRRVNVSAVVEQDADGDGFGDETQDACPSDATTQGTCPAAPDLVPPETTITGGPKRKTDKPKVTFTFEANEAGSTFLCSLKGKHLSHDLKGFSACGSPRNYKNLRPGRYGFFVFAVDLAGNPDATPAARKFKVLPEARR